MRLIYFLTVLLKLTLAAASDDGGPYAVNEALVALAPRPKAVNIANNGSQIAQPQLKDRALSFFDKRQNCPSGSGYCYENGYCCYLDQGCCPGGCCDAGDGCCWDGCIPLNADCCSDGGYCEVGNMCVISYDTGEIGCCTDLECTAVVTGGTTSYLYYSTPYYSTPDYSTPVISYPSPTYYETTYYITEAATSAYIYYQYYYWTITWWYYSYYWYYYAATSSVTYTTIYETTTYSVSATDVEEASSQFLALSATLTEALTPPAEATSLAASLSAEPTDISFSFSYEFGDGYSSSLYSASSVPTATSRLSGGIGASGGNANASLRRDSWIVAIVIVGVVLPGVLMVWL